MLSQKRLAEIREMVERVRALSGLVLAPGGAEEDCREMSRLLTVLGLGVVPELLAEIRRLQAKRPEPVMVKMDSRGGMA